MYAGENEGGKYRERQPREERNEEGVGEDGFEFEVDEVNNHELVLRIGRRKEENEDEKDRD